ncbi:MAG TPA: hypothetical protein VF117_04560 [Gammaproteobacteria bacterium]
MDVFRHKQMRRWIAASAVFAWLFTVGLCAVESHTPEVASAEAGHVIIHMHPGSHQHDGTDTDTCCQLQSIVIGTLAVVKLPVSLILVAIAPAAGFMLSAVFYADPAQRMVRLPPEPRRRHLFLVHSLQPQAPPL